MKRLLPALLFLLAAAVPALAAPPPIRFTASVSPKPARPGEVVTVTVTANVDDGWHIYSSVPSPGAGTTAPTATEIVSAGNWKSVGETTEDAPTRKFDANFGVEVGYHEKAATFTRQFRVPDGAKTGPMTATVHYQVCNASVCLPPTDARVTATAETEAGAARKEHLSPPAPAPPGRGGQRETPSSPPPLPGGEGGGEAGGIGFFLLAAIGAGLLALATPCVFPLIPITLTNFVKQADGDKKKLVRLSAGYAAGIVALYVALGAVVSATAGAAGISKLAANPYVNLGLFVAFVIFALSFFETITLHLPGNLSGLQTSAKKHGGTAGLALLGVTFVLASFTCTAPFIGTLLVAAAGGEKFRPLLGMLAFALAFASPFLVFAAFPQWISKIPKSGVWLARFKATLGFLELAAALKFLSNADRVWNWQFLTQPVLLAAWAVIFFCAALYLVGLLRFGIVAETEAYGARVPPARAAFAGLFAFFALYCFWGLAGRPLSPYVGAFLPPDGYGNAAKVETGLPWLSNYDAALAQAKAEGKPLLVDFTGYTCTNCVLNEKNVFPHPDVQAQFANFVRVQLYTDRNDAENKANQKLQLTKFGDIALPLYGIVDAQTGNVVDKTAGVQSVGGFREFLGRGLAKATKPTAALWAAYSPDKIQPGRPTVIDFTAAWCVNCKEIEHDVFEKPEAETILSRDWTTLRADLTQWNAPASVALQKKYGFGALPTIVLLDKDGREVKTQRITGKVSVAEFLKRLEAVNPSATRSLASR